MNKFEYCIIKDNKIEITGYDDKDEEYIIIPSMIDGYIVSQIEKRAIYGFDYLVSVTIPENIESIEAYAFSFSSHLKEVHLPSSLKEVAENAFYQCNMNDGGPTFIVEKGTFAYKYALECAKRNRSKIKLSQDYIIKDHIMYDKDMKEVIYCPNDIDDLIDDYVPPYCKMELELRKG